MRESLKSKLIAEPLKSPPASTPPKIPKLIQSTLTKTMKSAEKVQKSPITPNKDRPIVTKERTMSTGSKEKAVIRTPKPKKVSAIITDKHC